MGHWLLFAVIREPVQKEVPANLARLGLSLEVQGGLAVVLGPAGSRLAAPLETEASAFFDTLAALHQIADLLPFRFGVLIPSREEVRSLLARHAGPFDATLTAIEGCEEWSLTVKTVKERPRTKAPAASGQAYLMARASEFRAIEAVAGTLKESARSNRWIRNFIVEERPAGHAVLTFLIPRDRPGAAREVEEAVQAASGARAVLSGPFPPFSFMPNLAVEERGNEATR